MKIQHIVLATALLLNSALVFAESVHLPQAIEHTKAAITQGGAGHVPTFLEHASTAREHAKASEIAEVNPHTTEGILRLNLAIDDAEKGNAAAGTKHAKEALNHFELARGRKNK